MNQGQLCCRHCLDVQREFYDQEELDRHIAIRHGVKDKYGSIKGPPQKPEASGTDFEKIYAVLTWEGDLLEDQIWELRARKQKVDDLALSIHQVGNLDHHVKSKKPIPSVKKSAANKKTAAPGKAQLSKVGLSPAKGGTPPSGKPHWDASHSRWMKHPPKAKAHKHGKSQANKALPKGSGFGPRQTPVRKIEYAEQRTPKNAKRKRTLGCGRSTSGQDYEERQYEKEQAELEQLPLIEHLNDRVDRANGSVETPLAWVLHNHKAGASNRWGQSRANGETDDGMLTRINYELGDQGSWNGPDWSVVWRREKGSTWITIMMEGAEPVRLTGAELIVKVREVLEISAPEKAKKPA